MDNPNPTNSNLSSTGNFIHAFIQSDLDGHTEDLVTRFPPEPNGYLHIGHAKAICLNYGLAKLYGGVYNLRFDDTNPAKEDEEYVKSIIADIEWLGFNVSKRTYFASDYFDKFYECAVSLIKQGLAYVCELTPTEIKEYRGSLNAPGKDSPYRDRPIEENLDLFERMKNGEFPDGMYTLRAKVDMASPNINMRDPIIYRIAHIPHHNTGDKWCIYPMYDFAHPLEDAIEGVTHSICSLEFEDHRPIYDWFVDHLDFPVKPRQIEFAKLALTNTLMGKRYMRNLVETGVVDGWDDPRMATISGIRRRGVRSEAVRAFCDLVGVAKGNSRVDYSMFEHVIREDLQPISTVVMAVLNPVKLVITNYPDTEEMVTIENNPQNPEAGTREVPFSRELYIERDDFMEVPAKKFHRLYPGNEVRLKGAYFVRCTEVIKDENGEIVEIHATYDPETRSGSGFEGRKVKGTIHWVNARTAVKFTARLYDFLQFDDDTSESGYRPNDNSLTVVENCYGEPILATATLADRFQFMRNGYYCLDSKYSADNNLVFNRILSLKSSY